MDDRLEDGEQGGAVGEVQVELARWILERGVAPRAPPEVHGIQVADGGILRIASLQDFRTRLARPTGAGEEDPIAGRGTTQTGDRYCRTCEHGDRREGPKDRKQCESAATHPRSLIRKRSVSTTFPVSRVPFPALVTRTLTASGALTG